MDLAIVALLALLPCGALAVQNVSMKRRIARLEAVASESPSLMLGLSKWDGMPALKAAPREWNLPEELKEPGEWDGYQYTGPDFVARHEWYCPTHKGKWKEGRCHLMSTVVRPVGGKSKEPPKRVKKIKTEAEMRRILGCLK